MSRQPSQNFAFLAHHDTRLVALGTQAEEHFASDPSVTLFKLRQFGEVLAKRAAAKVGLYVGTDGQQALIDRLADSGVIGVTQRSLFHDLRRIGNAAVHEGTGDHSEALHQLRMARELAVWFQRSFGNNRKFDPGPFVPPQDPTKPDPAVHNELERLREEANARKKDLVAAQRAIEEVRKAAEAEALARLTAEERAQKAREDAQIWEALANEQSQTSATASKAEIAALAAQNKKLLSELVALQAAAQAMPAQQLEQTIEAAAEASEAIQLDEAATRKLIDRQLHDAGWEVDSERLSYPGGARPMKGRNLAIAEWPTKSGPADYVLFVGLMPVGIVEAKRKNKDVSGSLEQSKRYSRGYSVTADQLEPGGRWGQYKVPFLFATNGRPFLRQLETKSGIWFLDGRRPENLSRPLEGWYTPDGLVAMLKQDIDKAHEQLKTESTEYLGLRDYQLAAIRAVEAAIEKGKRECLVAMATGTGKTRTCIGLTYRLLKTRRFRRVLFLVDRSALGEQTANAYKDARLENLQTFADIFDMKELGDIKPDSDTKLQIATIQGMVKRILFPTSEDDIPPVDQYDCIVVDECHRGYLLDRELGDAEFQFRDETDYISKYRRVLDHFDAVKVGLTATPALHTTEIFGRPVFQYSYREAVIDGALIDHEPPIQIVTQLAEDGMRWRAGEQMAVYNARAQTLDTVVLPDEVNLEIESYNRRVITENFNRVVCAELANHIDPNHEGKTLIFCATDNHADLVVRLLKEALAAKYDSVEDDAVLKITGASDKPMELIRRYKNERNPSIAVTVDLLTTGIDVPAICNVVFLRRIRSRILYEQMLGRGTRRCDDIGKEVFRIFDAVDLYSGLEAVSTMKPVVADPKVSFAELVAQLAQAKSKEIAQVVLEEIVAKLQSKHRRIKGAAADQFEAAAGMTPPALLAQLRNQTPKDAATWFAAHQPVVELLDRSTGEGVKLIISNHADVLRRVERGYGKGEKPNDYLESFAGYLQANLNKVPALLVVTQRPRELTRQQLKELRLLLDGAGYTEAALQTAWRETTNQDIAASIIGFIRRAALGDALVPYGERVSLALKSILASQSWTDPQRKWLDRIGQQLRAEFIVDREALDRGQFKSQGGYNRINKVFDGKLDAVLGDLHEALWTQAA